MFWDQLLLLIEEGHIVPVVGRGLLVGDNGVPYLQRIAQELAQYLGVDPSALPVGRELDEVGRRFLSLGGSSRQLIYSGLKTVVDRTDIPLPSALVQLASIAPLRLFVSTTFDPLLERALNQRRADESGRVEVLSYAPDDRQDLAPDWEDSPRTTLYHLFGRISARPAYVVTEEDMLEFVHSLQGDTRQPDRLFDVLNRSNLLVLGGHFDGWLGRFFMRMPRRERLLVARDTTDYIVDTQVAEDEGLVSFTKGLSGGVEIVEGIGVRDFVATLHERWVDRHPASIPATTPPSKTVAAPRGMVFLSYASEDVDAARAVKEALEEHVDVFFDKEALKAGDDWEARLMRSIRQCSLFVPLVSQHTLTSGRRWFRAEWSLAEDEARKAAPNEAFLLPVVVDGTAMDSAAIPEKFAESQAVHLVDGRVPTEFVQRVAELYRRYQVAGVS